MRLLLGQPGRSSCCTYTAHSWQPLPVTRADQQQARCLQPAGVTPTPCLSCRYHLDLCWQWRSEEPDRAALDRKLGMEGLTSAAAFAGDDSAGGC